MTAELNHRELDVIDVVRRADEPWLPVREVTRRCSYRHSLVVGAVVTLRRRGLVRTRPLNDGLYGELEVAWNHEARRPRRKAGASPDETHQERRPVPTR